MKELGLVILTCFVLSSAELTEKNIKVLIVFERSMRRHKAFCSCAQRIIHKVNHWHLFKDFYKKVFQGKHTGHSLRPWEGLLSETCLWGKYLWQKKIAEFSSLVQSLGHVQLFATPWITAHQASLSITNSRSSHRLMSIESVMPSSHLILCRPLLLLSPIPPSITVFSN